MNTNPQFPYENFPYKLQYNEGKDKKVCYFECKEHLDKYLVRHKIKKKDVNIEINKKNNK
jgi:hypothetical protein